MQLYIPQYWQPFRDSKGAHGAPPATQAPPDGMGFVLACSGWVVGLYVRPHDKREPLGVIIIFNQGRVSTTACVALRVTSHHTSAEALCQCS